jgi:hypothetical protein
MFWTSPSLYFIESASIILTQGSSTADSLTLRKASVS